MTVLVETTKAVKRFGREIAVDRVSLSVGRGEVVGLLGANGAGKTTLIKMILGLLASTAGTVTLFGAPPSRRGRQHLGYVPQTLGLYTDLTVSENLDFVAGAFGTQPPNLDGDLAAAQDRPLGELAVGLRRRVAFAAALSHGPELLLLDEPTSGVGPLERAELWNTIRGAAESGTGVLVSTHYMEEAVQCDRLVVLAAGRVVAAGTPDEIAGGHTTVQIDTAEPGAVVEALADQHLPAFVSGAGVRLPEGSPDTVRRLLAEHGLDGKVSATPATLEEVFFDLAGR